MNSTGKILFGSFFAISIVLMFLIFSMQKNAQLQLDITDIQSAITAKETAIESIREELVSAQTTVQHTVAQNKLIPTLQNNLKTTEQEKLVYIQQLDDFQAELQTQVDIAEKQLTEIAALQIQQEEHQQLLNKSTDDITTAHQQKSELAAILHTTQQEIITREAELEEFIETLAQKDRVIQIYKEKLDKSAEDMTLLQVKDSNEKLNLKLILDELATKTATVEQLTTQLNWKNNPDAQAQAFVQAENDSAANDESQALIIKLSLENDDLGLEIQEHKNLLQELQNKLTSNGELVTSYATEIEQLRLTNSAKDNDIRILQNKINGIKLNSTQLKGDLDNKDKELQAAQTQSLAIAEPLTEKITTLELQLTQGATQYTQLAKSLSQAQTNLAAVQNERKTLTEELNSAKTANANVQTELSTLSGVLESKEVALLQEEDTRQLLASKIVPLKQALSESEERYAALTNNFTDLQQQLVKAVEAKAGQDSNSDSLQTEVSEQQTTIQQLEKRLVDVNSRRVELEGYCVEAEMRISKNDKINVEHEKRIARLIEEVAAAKAAGTLPKEEKQPDTSQTEAADSEAEEMTEEQPMELRIIKNEAPETLDEVMEKVQEEAAEESIPAEEQEEQESSEEQI